MKNIKLNHSTGDCFGHCGSPQNPQQSPVVFFVFKKQI